MLQVTLCGNSAEAKQAVADVATKLSFTVLDRGSLAAARELEDSPLELFPEWRLPLRLAIALAAFFFFYVLIRDVIYAYVDQGKDISFRIMVSLANKVKTVECHVLYISICSSLKANLQVCAAEIAVELPFCVFVNHLSGVSHCVAHHVGSVLPARCHSCLPSALQRNQIQVRHKNWIY